LAPAPYTVPVSNVNPSSSIYFNLISLRSELKSLVGGKEPNELWHDLNTDESGSVDIEMCPGSWEIGLDVLFKVVSLESIV